MPDSVYVLQVDDLEVLDEALRALNDASAVVDAGEDEKVAYEHEKRALYQLIERLAPGRASWFAPFGVEAADVS